MRFEDVSITRSPRRVSKFFARAALALFVGPVVLTAVAVAIGVGVDAVLYGWVWCWLVGVPVTALVGAIASIGLRRAATTVEADATGLLVGEGARARQIPIAQIESALAIAGGRPTVEIAIAGGDALRMQLAQDGADDSLLAALGFGPLQRRSAVLVGSAPVASSCLSAIAGVLVTLVSSCGLVVASGVWPPLDRVAGYIMAAFFLSSTGFIAWMLRQRRIVVGTDGIFLERPFGKQFIPIAPIFLAQITTSGLTLTLDDGETMRRIVLCSDTGARSAALLTRINQAMEAAGRQNPGGGVALLARAGRSLDAWRAELAKLVRAGGYRAETLPTDSLLTVAERAAAAPDVRLGAAIAIGLGEDDQAKARVRVATESIAHDKLRVAMAGAVDGAVEDALLEEALTEEAGSEDLRAIRRT